RRVCMVGRCGGPEVRHVLARPTLLLLIPPDVLLTLAPGFALRVGAGAVVHHAAISRPGETPVEVDVLAGIGLTLGCAVAAFFRVDAAIYPATAGSSAVIFQFIEARKLLL